MKYKDYLKKIYYLIGEDRKKIPLIILAFIASTILELIGIGLVAPYTALIISPDSPSALKILSKFEAYLTIESQRHLVIYLGIFLIFIFFLKLISSFFINKLILEFSYNHSCNLREKLLTSFQKIPFSEYLKRNSSSYVYSILNLSSVFSQGVLQFSLRLISESIVLISILAFLTYTSWKELGFFLILIGTIFYIYNYFTKKPLINLGKKSDDEMQVMVKSINEALAGFKEIRILNKQDYFHRRMDTASRNVSTARVRAALIKGLPRNIMEFAIIFFIVSLVIFAYNSNQNIGEFASIVGVFGVSAIRLIPSTNHIISAIAFLNNNRNAVDLLYTDISYLESLDLKENTTNATVPPSDFESLSLINISYKYENTNRQSLSNITVKISRGDKIGVIGESGAGKSTFASILTGLLTPTQGNFLYNGKNSNLPNQTPWVNQIAYIPQDVFIIDDSLKRNIALGVSDNDINPEYLKKILEMSNLSKFIKGLPNGLETIVGERGAQLSGGQRQRISIARALYFGKKIIIMDEATSALDNDTEEIIIDEINKLTDDITVIMIAHRLTSLRNCDKIIELSEGVIKNIGSYTGIISPRLTSNEEK